MKIEVKIISETDMKKEPEGARRSIAVETHSRRGDMFNVDKTQDVMEGSSQTFNVPTGGRLIVTTPETDEEFVYDRDQAASIRASHQKNDEGRADAPAVDPKAPPRPQMRASEPATPSQTPPKPGEAGSGKPDPVTGKMHPSDVAKEQQSQPRPAGEKAPLPGSPVGSPPAGNEGKGNK